MVCEPSIESLCYDRGDDDNVPVWHGRESFGIVETWNRILGTTSDIMYVLSMAQNVNGTNSKII